MIEYATLTGEIKEGLIGCMSFGRKIFARPVFGTAFQSIPSEMWLKKYSKHFFALITYENRKDGKDHDRPVFLGVVPATKSEYLDTNIEDKHKINTAKYRVYIDDTNEHLTIERFNGVSIHIKGDNVYIESKHINLGKETADYKAVLGDIADSLMNELTTILTGAKVNTGIGPQPFMPDTQAKLQIFKNKIKTMLSDVVRLD